MEDLWHPLGEQNKTVILVRSSAKEAHSLRAQRLTRQTRTYSKPVHQMSETQFFFSSFDLFHISLREKKIIGRLEAQKESLPLL